MVSTLKNDKKLFANGIYLRNEKEVSPTTPGAGIIKSISREGAAACADFQSIIYNYASN